MYSRVAAARWLAERGRKAASAEPALKKAFEQAHGAEMARITLTLARICGEKATGEARLALAALEDVLAVSEDVPPAVGSTNQNFFWHARYTAMQEDESVGAAVGVVWSRLQAGDADATVLGRALEDRSPYVRLAAAVALARVAPDHKGTIPVLWRLLERHPRFFGYAADTLAALGSKAAPLAPQMLVFTRHANGDMARAAARCCVELIRCLRRRHGRSRGGRRRAGRPRPIMVRSRVRRRLAGRLGCLAPGRSRFAGRRSCARTLTAAPDPAG